MEAREQKLQPFQERRRRNTWTLSVQTLNLHSKAIGEKILPNAKRFQYMHAMHLCALFQFDTVLLSTLDDQSQKIGCGCQPELFDVRLEANLDVQLWKDTWNRWSKMSVSSKQY